MREQRRLKALIRVFPWFERRGIHLSLNHFYGPVPELRTLPEEIFERHSELPGVEMRDEEQLALLDRISAFRGEYSGFPEKLAEGEPMRYFQRNGQFERVDAEVFHTMIRLHKPRRIIEIGSGYSTLVAAGAIRRNRDEDPGYECDLICVEPYPREFIPGLKGVTRLEETRVQDLPVDFFSELGENDILFVDSSHVLKIGSDVQYEFLEVVPRVAPGVLVQVHDIFFPTDYPKVFVKEWLRFFTEQYLLQSFLAFNDSFEVRWCGSWMARLHEPETRAAFPSYDRGGMLPSSFWMQRVS